MTTEKVLQTLIGEKSEERTDGFLKFLSAKLWSLYDQYLMDKVKMLESKISWNLKIDNAKENKPYSCMVGLPEIHDDHFSGVRIVLESVAGVDEETHGLSLKVAEDGKSFTIEGTPTLDKYRRDGNSAPSTFDLVVKYRFEGMEMPSDCPSRERKIPFVINQDPRKLWREFPVDWDHMPDPKYKKDDVQVEYVKVESLADGTPQKDIVAASKRGRSHANEGKPRDDHFKLRYMENGWYIIAVADGAGSAKYSRKGSEIACEEVVNNCIVSLTGNKKFEEAIALYNSQKAEDENGARKEVGDIIYEIVGNAALKAHKAINNEAAATKNEAKQYATTLLLTICKRFPFGWFVASFWVGDGAICLYDRVGHTAKILGVPDEGEYAGQTRFLTMPEIFKDTESFYKRLRFNIIDDFTALFLMTDGVSDPKFETDANLCNPDRWDALWDDLKENGVELTDDNEESKGQLLKWLDFWSPGNHDDRTIAILYEGETPESPSEYGSDEVCEVSDGEVNQTGEEQIES